MTVNLGPKRLLGATTLLGASQFTGQGNTNTAKDVEWELLFSTDDAAVAIPSWTYIQSDMRAFSVSRGRASELSDMDAGTASITLDNRTREYDPANASSPFSPNLRPMNQVWLRMRFNGATHDIFKGWVESYEQQLPESGLDAITIVHAVDEFKVLSLRNLPATDPPRETYADVVQFDQPGAYWPMTNSSSTLAEDATIGPQLAYRGSSGGSMTTFSPGAIVGEPTTPGGFQAMGLGDGGAALTLETEDLDLGVAPDLSGCATFAVEVWLRVDTLPTTAPRFLLRGPDVGGGNRQWHLALNTGGSLAVNARTASATNVGFNAGAITPGTGSGNRDGPWHHIVFGIRESDTFLRLFINGVEVSSASWPGGVLQQSALTAGSSQMIVNDTNTSVTYTYYDELAVYRQGLAADRVLAHYTAGVSRGFPRGQLPGARLGAILDSISSQAPRAIRAGARPMDGQYEGTGRATLETLRDAESAEAVDAVVFIACDGTVTFLDGGHRSVSPWDTVQATFGDASGTELDYMDIQLDYSDSFIANEWNVSRESGTTQTASDTTSISRYYKRQQSLTGLKLRDDADATDIAADMLAKYKEPLTRILSITPKTMNTDVIDQVFRLDLGDRITVKLTPPGGGARVDQTLFVQSVSIDATPQAIFPTVKLGVSPV
jgi:concanavalin A-like lectin/glucanase superfamily protein